MLAERGNRICLSCTQAYNAVVPPQYPILPLYSAAANAAPVRPADLFDSSNNNSNSTASKRRRPSVSLVAAAAANACAAAAAAAVARAAVLNEAVGKPNSAGNGVPVPLPTSASGPSARVVAPARTALSRSGAR
jgi:hypothetical protein